MQPVFSVKGGIVSMGSVKKRSEYFQWKHKSATGIAEKKKFLHYNRPSLFGLSLNKPVFLGIAVRFLKSSGRLYGTEQSLSPIGGHAFLNHLFCLILYTVNTRVLYLWVVFNKER